MRARLQAAQAEAARASMQRDHTLRLLRQQQSLNARRIENEKVIWFMQKQSFLARLFKRVPRGLKDKIPLPVKQFLKDVIVRIG